MNGASTTVVLPLGDGYRYEFDDSGQDPEAIRLWATGAIPFDGLNPGQGAARAELRKRLNSLTAGPGEILVANFTGPKAANADIENIVLYNIGGACFTASMQHGVRFEYAGGPVLPSPSEHSFPCAYEYGLNALNEPLRHWKRRKRLAQFRKVDLGPPGSPKALVQVWRAVRRANTMVIEQRMTRSAPFGMFLRVGRPTGDPKRLTPALVKSLVDGTVSALQAHGDQNTVDEMAARLAKQVDMRAEQIAAMLVDTSNVVLGSVWHLVHRFRKEGVQWNPSDQLCVAGEVLLEVADGPDWQLSGEVWELMPSALTPA
ncbi:MAG TPA: hypothetical protein VFN57_09030 [Thermomicrobiaceae bacterium]|nr:hypothetical protein [Thermomicrobiaceae bacterium]